MQNFLIGLIFSSLIALGGYLKQSLSLSGALSAVVLGTLIFYLGGLYFAGIMVAFFLSSSLLTKYKQSFKKESEKFHDKGGRRDITQVAANGFLGLAYSILFYFTKNPAFILGYVSAFASANSDTWASEIGVLSKKAPISILTLKPMTRGMSGGISLLGTAASIIGSGFIAFLSALGYGIFFEFSSEILIVFIITAAAGFAGNLIDSLLGAALQAKYRCRVCGGITERRIHHNTPCELIAGISPMNNNAVNLLSSLIASLGAVVVYGLIR